MERVGISIGCSPTPINRWWQFATSIRQPHGRVRKRKSTITTRRNRGENYRCDAHADFRDLLNRKDIDAVHVATPDHWHVIPALMGLKAGKHVICEKPLSLTLREGRILADAAKQSGRVFQTASENRSIESYIRMVELVRAGVFGQIKHVKILLPHSNRLGGEMDSTLSQPPPELNYDMWQGQAADDAVLCLPRPLQLSLEPRLLRRHHHRLGRPHDRLWRTGPRAMN